MYVLINPINGAVVAKSDSPIVAGDGDFFVCPGQEIHDPAPSSGAVPVEIPDTEPVPEYVTQLQARLAIFNAGLLEAATAAVTAQGAQATIAWEYTSIVKRNSPFVIQAAIDLGLSDAQLDALFIAASKIEV